MSEVKEGNENDHNEKFSSHVLDWRKRSDVPAEIKEQCELNSLAPAAVLRHCERYVLIPYLYLLSVTGLRPSPPGVFPPVCRTPDVLGSPCFGGQENDGSFCAYIVSAVDLFHLVHTLLMMIFGHILQYMACFQQIGGFCVDCGACGRFSLSILMFIIPAIMQLAAHCHVIWLFRVQEVELLPNLMERVFLLSSRLELNGVLRSHALVRHIWLLTFGGAVWGLVSISHLIWLIYAEDNFKFYLVPGESFLWNNDILRIILIMGMGWQEVSKAAIITSYCIHAHLLSYYLKMLHCSLLRRGETVHDWMREVAEFEGLLGHLNDDLSPSAIGIAALSLGSAIAGALTIFSTPVLHAIHSWVTFPVNTDFNQTSTKEMYTTDSRMGFESIVQHNETLPFKQKYHPLLNVDALDVLIISLKIALAFAPLIQAARVSNGCRILRSTGHIVRARPFAYRNAPPSPSLDSLLLYTSSLKLSATLLPCAPLPVTPSCLFVSIILGALIPITLVVIIALVHMYQMVHS